MKVFIVWMLIKAKGADGIVALQCCHLGRKDGAGGDVQWLAWL
jgi:hypothetical protein